MRAAAAPFATLSAARWYGDPGGAAAAPLRVGNGPVVFGVSGDMIEWSLAGAIAASPELPSVCANWVAPR